ncbi:transporter substrate-binding domain-containing protein [Suttonella ornithocola]|uniref:Probable amino-acid ABC transporter-binding protein HI_1080 n=1 Tax=Suttonella ornithocola TaxID=279832 RepID=A0A380MTV4_9GAMM|nr:transporter substrate-binding domain-containing protein [Suttonella ornithocola]SUO95486.1 Probable amino-acid ABC transporter-binding protein HI_1080 precursor [Suttonella ornithocola]
MKSLLFLLSFLLFSSFSHAESEKTYKVATDPTYPPFEFIDEKGEIIGLDIDILKAIAKNQNFKLTFYHKDWSIIFNELTDKRADIIINGFASTDLEPNIANISNPYLTSLDCISYLDDKNLSDWQKHTIAVSEDEILAKSLQEEVKNLVLVKTPFMALKEVILGNANWAAADCNLLKYYLNSPTIKNRGYNFKIKTIENNTNKNVSLVIALNKDDEELLNKINTGLENIKKNGELETLLKKWKIN